MDLGCSVNIEIVPLLCLLLTSRIHKIQSHPRLHRTRNVPQGDGKEHPATGEVDSYSMDYCLPALHRKDNISKRLRPYVDFPQTKRERNRGFIQEDHSRSSSVDAEVMTE